MVGERLAGVAVQGELLVAVGAAGAAEVAEVTLQGPLVVEEEVETLQPLYVLHPHRRIPHPRHLISRKLHRNSHLLHLWYHQYYHHLELLLQR